jgi:cytochrome c nitrite reductase small subunit
MNRRTEIRTAGGLALALAIGAGIAAGIGGYTFSYAKGLSYLSTDPAACGNCHIMQPQLDAWARASHHGVAVCVDCHLPQTFLDKYAVKLENGWRHGKLFTTQTFAEPIRAQPAGMAILQDNCVRCHDALVHDLAPGTDRSSEGMRCVHCHFDVGHGQRTGIGGPLRADETRALEKAIQR